jgi:hypothetical protein
MKVASKNNNPMKMINILLVFTMFLSFCKKEKCPEQGIIIDEGEIISNVIFEFDSFTPLHSLKEYVIRNSNENTIGAKIKIGSNSSFDTINYNNYSLLGKRIMFQSSGIIKRRIVSIDNKNKLVSCTIVIKSCGFNKVAVTKHTWMLTNKIPDDYEVVFNVIGK